MMAGAGIIPPPFARADAIGLDEVLAALERAEAEWGEAFAAAADPAAPGRPGPPGPEDRPGLLPLPAARRGLGGGRDGQARDPRRHRRSPGSTNPPANSISPEVWRSWRSLGARRRRGRVRALVFASANPMLFARERHQGVHADGRGRRRASCSTRATRLLRDSSAPASSRSPPSTASRSAAAASWPWPATCGSRPTRPRFGQPEINLGIIPGFGGTQRLPRLVGPAKALEMNLVGDAIAADEAYEFGLVNRVVPDHELFDTALAWARKLAGQAPLAVGRSRRSPTRATSTRASRPSSRSAASDTSLTCPTATGACRPACAPTRARCRTARGRGRRG